MWPFKKKADGRKPPDAFEKTVNELKEFADVGEMFTFCGIEFMVYSHTEFYKGRWYPAMLTMYKNHNGMLRERSFDIQQIRAIKPKGGNDTGG